LGFDLGVADRPPLPPPIPVEEMTKEQLIAAARKGNAVAMRRLRPMMWADRDRQEQLGNLGSLSMKRWLDFHCGQDLHLRERLWIRSQGLREALLSEGDSLSEKLMVDEILVCELRHHCWISLEVKSLKIEDGHKLSKFVEEQSRTSQRMYLKAIAALRDFRIVKPRMSSATVVVEATEGTSSGPSEE